MRYQDINALDEAIERRADRYIKHYYSDWKNYDRPAYMGYKGASERTKKHILILFREMGSYIFSDWDFLDRKAPAEIIDYYLTQDRHGNYYFFVDLEKLTLKKASEEEVRNYITKYQRLDRTA